MYAAAAGAAAAYSLPPHMHQMATVNLSQTGQLLTAAPAVTTQANNTSIAASSNEVRISIIRYQEQTTFTS